VKKGTAKQEPKKRLAKQLPLPIRERFKHGGARKGAGRPKTSKLQPHAKREVFQARHPLHVTVRLRDGLPSLRGKEEFRQLKKAISKARARGLAIAHFAILSNHLHLVLEAQDKRSLGRQMQSFGISLAKRLNATLKRKGAVLRERYYVHILRTPSEVKRAIVYVLGNAFKHAGSKGRIALDLFSSSATVADDTWHQLLGKSWRMIVGFPLGESPGEDEKLLAELHGILVEPRTWLLAQGWRRARATA
jgi:REP element-mobilizing transposase RayT